MCRKYAIGSIAARNRPQIIENCKIRCFSCYFKHQLRVFRLYYSFICMLTHFKATESVKMRAKHMKKNLWEKMVGGKNGAT